MSMSMFLIPCVCVCVCVCRLMLVTKNNRFPLEFITTREDLDEKEKKEKQKQKIYKTTHANTCRAHEPSRFQLHLRLRNTDTIASSGSRVQGVTIGAVLEELSPQEKRKK